MEPSSTSSKARYPGFSLVELIIAVAVLGLVATIALPFFGEIGAQTRSSALETDVGALNRAVALYLASGGTFEGTETVTEVLNKLKTARNSEESRIHVGMNGRLIDARLSARPVKEANSSQSRAVWDSATSKFKLVQGGPGVETFFLDESLADVDFGTESRNESALNYNADDGWIWAYQDRPIPVQEYDPPVVTTIVSNGGPPSPSSAPVTLSPPGFLPNGNSFDPSLFPIPLEFSNPNDPSTTVMYSLNGGAFAAYSGTVAIPPNTTVSAYTQGDPAKWVQSSVVTAFFSADPPQPLLAPGITLSAPAFTDSVTAIEITITNPNPGGSSNLLYTMTDPGGSPPDLSAWSAYGGPFTATNSSFPSGFAIHAIAQSVDSLRFENSPVTNDSASVEFFGIPISGDVLFVIDSSASMNKKWGSGNTSRMEAVMSALYSTIQQIPPMYSFNVIGFNFAISFSDNSGALMQATDANKQAMIDTLKAENFGNGKGTNYEAAFAAVNQFATPPSRVIFLTDGEPTMGDHSLEILQLANNQVRVDSIGVALTSEGELRLAEIATATGGTWVNVEDYQSGN